jgi:hypothetical protein
VGPAEGEGEEGCVEEEGVVGTGCLDGGMEWFGEQRVWSFVVC